jgi:hypothetical protein
MDKLTKAKLECVKAQFEDKLKRGCSACRKINRYTPIDAWVPPVID